MLNKEKKLIGVKNVFDLNRVKVFPPNKVVSIKIDVHASL